MTYVYIDGDDIGLKIENCFMNNNEVGLTKININIKDIINFISEFLISEGYEIIFNGADGIICKCKTIDEVSLLNSIKKISSNYNFSVGVGNSLRDSFLALRYAKANGKNILAIFDQKFKLIK